MTSSQRITAAAPRPDRPVSCSDEWSTLEEVVVGRFDGAVAEARGISADDARRDLENLRKTLEGEGVSVRRPANVPHAKIFETPDWKERGFSSACPRDGVLVVGDRLIETPLGWRARYYETDALRELFLEYFRAGARWSSAPRPELLDELYDAPDGTWLDDVRPPAVVNESEPILCASDVLRSGRDLFVMASPGTNRAGITWLGRHLGDGYRVHTLEPTLPIAANLDTVLHPLGPTEVLVREGVFAREALVTAFPEHTIRTAPVAAAAGAAPGMNVLQLDPKRILVEQSERALVAALRAWGHEPIPVALAGYAALGGSIRRATLDIRRREPTVRRE